MGLKISNWESSLLSDSTDSLCSCLFSAPGQAPSLPLHPASRFPILSLRSALSLDNTSTNFPNTCLDNLQEHLSAGQNPRLYMMSSVYGRGHFPWFKSSSCPTYRVFESLLAPSLCSSIPPGLTLPDSPCCPRRRLPAPAHLLLLFSEPGCLSLGFSRGCLFIIQVSA